MLPPPREPYCAAVMAIEEEEASDNGFSWRAFKPERIVGLKRDDSNNKSATTSAVGWRQPL